MIALLLAALLLTAPPAPAPSVTVVGPATPVEIVIEQPALPGRPVRYTLTNHSHKPILGAVVAVMFYDANGARQIGPAEITAMSLVNSDPPLAPGAVKNVAINQSFVVGRGQHQAPPTRSELRLDYVLYQDGTHWGPDSTHSGARIPAMRLGASLELDQMRQLLQQGGAAALLQHIGVR